MIQNRKKVALEQWHVETGILLDIVGGLKKPIAFVVTIVMISIFSC